jgi:hypothetical protein
MCSFSGTRDVIYGANGHFITKTAISGGIMCDNAHFGGDPEYGTVKACYYNGGSASVGVGPPGSTFCANENEDCSFSGTKDVAYGANGKWVWHYGVAGGIHCSNGVFGDPIPGTYKACYWIDPSGAPQADTNPWVFCASEGSWCGFSGTMNVEYGANPDHFTTKYYLTGGIQCSNGAFGMDLYYGVGKACYIKNSVNTQTGGCPSPNWEMQANHWKWVNQVIVHAPYGGTAAASVGASGTTENYYFGNGGTVQTTQGDSLSTKNGETVGTYKLMGAAYYHASNTPTSCGSDKVVLTDYAPQYRDSRSNWAIWGPSRSTDADDILDFWSYSTAVNSDVKAFTIDHLFHHRDDGTTTGPTGTTCHTSSSDNGVIAGYDISVSFTTPTGGGTSVSVGGQLKHTTTQTTTASYQYCFGNSHSYDWQYLGGTSPNLEVAFRTNW